MMELTWVPMVDTQTLKGSDLVLPALTHGNVAQLALDLLIKNVPLTRVGIFDDPFSVPMAGHGAFDLAEGEEGPVLTTSMEVFHNSEKKLTVLQRRAPVREGANHVWTQQVWKWVEECQFRNVLILYSADGTQRIDSQLEGFPFRFVSSKDFEGLSHSPSSQIPALESDSEFETLIPPTSVVHNLNTLGKSSSVPTGILLLFCMEGDNIPEALQMAGLVPQMLEVKLDSTQFHMPSVWSKLGGRRFDPTLFT